MPIFLFLIRDDPFYPRHPRSIVGVFITNAGYTIHQRRLFLSTRGLDFQVRARISRSAVSISSGEFSRLGVSLAQETA
jgi:hypothetical protein